LFSASVIYKYKFTNNTAVHRRTATTMDNIKRTKEQTMSMIYKTLHRKLKIRATRTPLKTEGELF
jgi:hypothetical protein